MEAFGWTAFDIDGHRRGKKTITSNVQKCFEDACGKQMKNATM